MGQFVLFCLYLPRIKLKLKVTKVNMYETKIISLCQETYIVEAPLSLLTVDFQEVFVFKQSTFYLLFAIWQLSASQRTQEILSMFFFLLMPLSCFNYIVKNDLYNLHSYIKVEFHNSSKYPCQSLSIYGI